MFKCLLLLPNAQFSHYYSIYKKKTGIETRKFDSILSTFCHRNLFFWKLSEVKVLLTLQVSVVAFSCVWKLPRWRRRLKFSGLWSVKLLEHDSVRRKVKCSDWKAGKVEKIWKSFAISSQIKLNFVSKLNWFWCWIVSINRVFMMQLSMIFLDCSISMMKEMGSFYENLFENFHTKVCHTFPHPFKTNFSTILQLFLAWVPLQR